MTTKTQETQKEKKKTTENDTVIKPIRAQKGFLTSKARYPAYVAGWGTGKSLAGIGKALDLSENYPGNLGMIFRKEYTDLKDSTIKDFETYTGIKIDSSREVRFPNNSVIMFRHLEETNNLMNVNLGWFWIEQAEEMDTDDQFFKLFGRLRRKKFPHQGFITANTRGHNWIYKLWKLKSLDDSELFEATTYDNAHNLPPSFIKSQEILKENKPTIYRRFVLNSWEDSDTTDIIIDPRWILAAQKRDLMLHAPIRRIVSVDVARYGDDRTVMYALEMGANQLTKVLGKQSWEKKNTMETVGLATIFARKYDIEAFAIDEIGVGAGVADRLNELEHEVIYVNSAKKSGQPQQYYNIRAEIYDNGAKMFEGEKIELDPEDMELEEELSWVKYKTVKSNGVYQVEAKEDIKKRIGRSPDCADAFLNGLWALPHVGVTKDSIDKYERKRRRLAEENDNDPMAV